MYLPPLIPILPRTTNGNIIAIVLRLEIKRVRKTMCGLILYRVKRYKYLAFFGIWYIFGVTDTLTPVGILTLTSILALLGLFCFIKVGESGYKFGGLSVNFVKAVVRFRLA